MTNTINTVFFWIKDTQGRYLTKVRESVTLPCGGWDFITTSTEWLEVKSHDLPLAEGEAPYWADWFTHEELEELTLNDLIPLGFDSAELIEVSEMAKKQDIYSTISDVSKDCNGFRHRLDVNAYSLEELQSILDGYYAQLERQIEEEREEEKERVRVANEKALAARKFDKGFGSMANALGGI